MLYIIKTTCDVFFCPMCLMFCFVLSIGFDFSSDLLYVLYCHVHSGSVLLAHVSYVLFCLWPFRYLSPSTSGVFCHLTFYFVLSFTISFPYPMCHIFYIVISTWNLVFYPMCPKFNFIFPFGLRSSNRCIVCFILPCPSGMCYGILCVFSSLTLFFIRCVIGFIFSFYQGWVLLSYVLFCLVHS